LRTEATELFSDGSTMTWNLTRNSNVFELSVNLKTRKVLDVKWQTSKSTYPLDELFDLFLCVTDVTVVTDFSTEFLNYFLFVFLEKLSENGVSIVLKKDVN